MTVTALHSRQSQQSRGANVHGAHFLEAPVVFGASGERIDRAPWTSLAEHEALWGSPLSTSWLEQRIEQSGLTGRGGAHVPAAWKWRAAQAAGPGGTVVVNGAEGEPASGKDAALLQMRPHLVLDGAAEIARGIGAREIVLWIHESAGLTRTRLAFAVRERRDAGLDDPPIRMLLAPDGYVSGESSAVIRAIQGGPALPQHARDRATPWGDGPPILVHNAETCARIGVLARGDDYIETSLVTVAQMRTPSRMHRRTVMEACAGSTIADMVRIAEVEEPSAILLGGYGGTWLSWDRARDLPVDPDLLRDQGLSLGAGVIMPLPRESDGRESDGRESDGLAVAAVLLDYLAAESARQCGPCVFGLPAMAEALHKASRGRDSAPVRDIAGLIGGRGACRHPDGSARMALSALEVFS